MSMSRAMVAAYVAVSLLVLVACGDDPEQAVLVQPVYGDPCRFLDCGEFGICVESADGSPACVCETGRAGTTCESCAVGFHRDGNNRCVSDVRCADQPENPCGAHGTCLDDNGVVECLCDHSYSGPRCELCEEGFGRDEFDRCLTRVLGAASASGGMPAVQSVPGDAGMQMGCAVGYAGPTCLGCAVGYHASGGGCERDERCDGLSCPARASCEVVGGISACTCEPGYTGSGCAQCASGFHASDSGTCVPDEVCAPTSCPPKAQCDDSAGAPICNCEQGWSGDLCLRCDQVVTQAVGFEYPQGWPASSNTCGTRSELTVADVTFRSRQGDGTVRVCAGNTIGGLTTQHIGLEADGTREAELSFFSPVFLVSFRVGTTSQPLAMGVYADDVQVERIELAAGETTSVTLSLIGAPARRIAFLNDTIYRRTIYLDDVVYHYDDCQ